MKDTYLVSYRGDIWFLEVSKEQVNLLHYLQDHDILPDDFEFDNVRNVTTDCIEKED